MVSIDESSWFASGPIYEVFWVDSLIAYFAPSRELATEFGVSTIIGKIQLQHAVLAKVRFEVAGLVGRGNMEKGS